MGSSISILPAREETDCKTDDEARECSTCDKSFDVSAVFFFVDSRSFIIRLCDIVDHLGCFSFGKCHGSPPNVKLLFVQYSNIYFKKVERHRYLG